MPRGDRVPPKIREAYYTLRDVNSRAAAARGAHIDIKTAEALDRIRNEGMAKSGQEIRAERFQKENGDPLTYEELCAGAADENHPEHARFVRAKRGWEDFAFFQRTYLGRIAVPWQVEAAQRIVALVDTDEEEWAVINCPPGSGKSTTFTHDIPCWLTVRDRAITGLIGTAIQTNGKLYIQNLEETFERTIPYKAHPHRAKLGQEIDAEATLAEDFGRFKTDKGIWAADRFVVAQPDGQATNQKEPTWSCYGRKGGVLGMRYQFVIWDDLVDPDRVENQQLINEDREWYSDIAESRLEPGGTFILQGQRLGPNDLYGYALKMKRMPDQIDPDAEEEDIEGTVPKYAHIKYKAHYEELCEGNHSVSAPPYGEPGGCLLFPRRLSWRRLSPIMVERQNRFQVLYQQEELDPEEVLVHKNWVSGEGGFIGCWDKDRDHRELPPGIDPKQCLSFVVVDPSPTQYWGITWWLIDPDNVAGAHRYLIDLERRSMGANKFLDFIASANTFVGLAEEWQVRSYELGIPITHWIIERNSAPFWLQTDMIQQWQRRHGVRLIPHVTSAYNKNSEELGLQALVPGPWERGLIRLPGKFTRDGHEKGRAYALKLVEEVTSHPHSHTTDCLITNWIMEFHLPELVKAQHRRELDHSVDTSKRPTWYEGTIGSLAKTANINVRHVQTESGPQRMMRLMRESA